MKDFSIKTLIWLATFFCGFPLLTIAGEMTDEKCLVIELNDGTKETYFLKNIPIITFTDTILNLTVGNGEVTTYPLRYVVGYYFSNLPDTLPTDNPSVDTQDSIGKKSTALILELTDGDTDRYFLADMPVITFKDSLITFKRGYTETSYSLKTVNYFYFDSVKAEPKPEPDPDPEPDVPDTVEAPVFAYAGGRYSDSVRVSLSCYTQGADIMYRLDREGAFTLYGGAFYLYDTAVIEAYAVKEDMANSDTVEVRYEVFRTPEPEPVIYYTLTVQANNAAWGTVSGSGTYKKDTTVQIKAVAGEGYKFVQWQEDNDTNAVRFVKVVANATYTAVFAEDMPTPPVVPQDTTYTLTVQANNAAWGTVSGSGTYKKDTTVQIKAVANEGYRFVQWQEDNDTNAVRFVKVVADATYTAVFEEDTTPDPDPSVAIDGLFRQVPTIRYTDPYHIEVEGVGKVFLYDMVGRLLRRAEADYSGTARINLQGLPTGVFLLRTDDGRSVKIFCK